MKYIVMLGINKFAIPDGATALNFAELALKYYIPSEYNKELKPLISIENEKTEPVVACIDCKYNEEGGYCVKNETTVEPNGTCEVAERW